MKKVLLLLIVASHISGSEPLDLSLIPRSYNQALPVLVQGIGRRPTRFEQGIVKKAIEKLEKIFKEQAERGLEFNLLTLPFELQVQILDRLSLAQLGLLAQVSTAHAKLVASYREVVTSVDISDWTGGRGGETLWDSLFRLYPQCQKICIYNPFTAKVDNISDIYLCDLTQEQSECFASFSKAHRILVELYRKFTTRLDLSKEKNITEEQLRLLGSLYPAVEWIRFNWEDSFFEYGIPVKTVHLLYEVFPSFKGYT